MSLNGLPAAKFTNERLASSPLYLYNMPIAAALRAYARGGVGVKTPLELDFLQKLYYLRKGD